MRTFASAALPEAQPRPRSDVSSATGWVGALGLAIALIWLRESRIPLAWQTLIVMGATAFPMILWLSLVERAWARQSTGLDFQNLRPWAETWTTTRVKLIGVWVTWALIAAGYLTLRYYAKPAFDTYFLFLILSVPFLLVGSFFYVLLIDRRMVEPRDHLWHFGHMVMLGRDYDRAVVIDHMRCWLIKMFFLAFMIMILPGIVGSVTVPNWSKVTENPVNFTLWLIQLCFVFDVVFGALGYIFTTRLLDAHFRSANPLWAGWVAALICYPPFALMGAGGALNYHIGTLPWHAWLDGSAFFVPWACALVLLAAIYAWSTVVFGLRFSNLTHRGILTHGPYAVTKHPAYLAKNLFWWLTAMPFLSTDSGVEALRNCLLLLSVNAIYYARAKTEERHLMVDPAYQAYADWIARHGLFARLRTLLARPKG